MHECIYVCMHVCMCTQGSNLSGSWNGLRGTVHTYTRARMHEYKQTYTYIHTLIHTYIQTHTGIAQTNGKAYEMRYPTFHAAIIVFTTHIHTGTAQTNGKACETQNIPHFMQPLLLLIHTYVTSYSNAHTGMHKNNMNNLR